MPVYHFITNNPNHNPDYERGQKGGNPKCDAFNSSHPLVYLEKRYIGWHKMVNRRQTPYIPYTDGGFLSHNYILIVIEYFYTWFIMPASLGPQIRLLAAASAA